MGRRSRHDLDLLHSATTADINEFLDNALGKQFCRRCNGKIDQTTIKYAGMRDKNYCYKCWSVCYGRDQQ